MRWKVGGRGVGGYGLGWCSGRLVEVVDVRWMRCKVKVGEVDELRVELG